MPEDFERWASWGNTEWTFAKVLPYMKKLEADQDFKSELHGADGPMYLRRYEPDTWGPGQQAFYLACRDAAFPIAPTTICPMPTGVGPLAFNMAGRTRVNTALAYLDPARARPRADGEAALPGAPDHLRGQARGGAARDWRR